MHRSIDESASMLRVSARNQFAEVSQRRAVASSSTNDCDGKRKRRLHIGLAGAIQLIVVDPSLASALFPRNIFHHLSNICDAISGFKYHAD